MENKIVYTEAELGHAIMIVRQESTEHERCICCKASTKKYWYKITPGLVDILIEILKKVKETDNNSVQLKDLYDVLTPYQTTQMTKLRFHALIAKHRSEDGKQDGWLITDRGGKFLRNEMRVPRRVQTFRNKVVAHDPETVGIYNLVGGGQRAYLETVFETERATVDDLEQTNLL